jgi:hypothetical protein
MPKLTPDELAERPTEFIEERSAAARARIQERFDRASDENRDLTPREDELTAADKHELSTIRDALELRSRNAEYRDQAVRAIDQAIEMRSSGGGGHVFGPPTLLVSAAHLAEHAQALSEGRAYGAIETIETRARLTAAGDLGSAGAWDPGQPNEPRHLIMFAGIPVSELTGRTAQVPAYTGPTAAAGVDENTAHGEYDLINPVNLTGLRYGRWSDVGALANVVDDLRGVNQMHGWGIARDLDLLAVTAIETAAGTPSAFSSAIDGAVRKAILQVAANSYSDESQLVIVGTPGDVALLTDTTPANGPDVGSVSVRFCGARLYPTTAATAGQVRVFAPNAFRVFQTKLQSASLIDPTSGANKFGSWIHSTGIAQQIIGSALAVDVVTP